MTKVKICGLKTFEAVQTAVAAGADYVGFVLAPSKRQVTLDQAGQLAQLIPDTVEKVGVFVSPTKEELLEAIAAIPLDLVQIHGDWDDSLVEQLPVPVIRAIQVTAGGELPQTQADYLLFDAPVAGSGQTFDWQVMDTSRLEHPFFIAGGLTVDNVQAAIRRFMPYAVDVSSGVETNGQKDLQKIRAFIERVNA